MPPAATTIASAQNNAARGQIYRPKQANWAHQTAGLGKMEGRTAFALLMAMRTGKTKTLLDDFGRLELAGEIDDLLLVAPAGVYRTWMTALDDHLSDDLKARLHVHLWEAKAGARAKAALNLFIDDRSRPRMLLVNVEALSGVARARELVLQFARQRRSMIVIDESTVIKNYRAKRTKFINKELAPLGAYRRILSGLPTPKSPLDIYTQFEFLDRGLLGYTNFFSFRAHFAVMVRKQFAHMPRPVDIVVGYRNTEELQRLIAPHSHRVLLEDCYDLPPKIYQRREVTMTDEQARIYKEIKEFATAKLDEEQHVTATMVMTQILRMHQVLCGHTGTELGERFTTIPENRTSELLALLEEHDGKAIIWCSYDHDVRKVAEAINVHFDGAKVARFWGGNTNTREDEERMFQTDPACRHMVATAAAGGRGRMWAAADLVVYYSNTSNLEHRSQSEERAQGVHKINSVLYVDLVVPGTVDEKILTSLRNKIDMAATVTGDDYREWLI